MQQQLLNVMEGLGVQLSNDALLALLVVLFSLLGYLVGRHLAKRRFDNQLRLAVEQHQQQRETDQLQLDDQLDHLRDAFGALSQQALQANNSTFLTLAQQSFAQLKSGTISELNAREQSFANLIKPIENTIKDTEQQLRKLDTERKVSEARLNEQLRNLLSSHHGLQTETRNLVNALRRPEVRGQWGEITLRRLVELSGMSERCDFTEQTSVNTENGSLRPDMIIQLPNQRQLVVDVKTPLDAYISASEASNDDDRKKHLLRHSKNVKQRIKELANKQYWQQFEQSPEFIILFIPGDQFLSSALDVSPNLLESALEQKILLATPTSLVGLLRAIAYGWNQDTLSRNSVKIRATGERLLKRLEILNRHFKKLGQSLNQSVDNFNRLVGSFQQNALPTARKLSELGLGSKDQLDDVEQSDRVARKMANDDNSHSNLAEEKDT